jgi:hypothetical protein
LNVDFGFTAAVLQINSQPDQVGLDERRNKECKARVHQRPDFSNSTLVGRCKWGKSLSTGLWSEVTTERMTADVRKLRSLYKHPQQNYNAFDRVRGPWPF